jgi:hypothetical protein
MRLTTRKGDSDHAGYTLRLLRPDAFAFPWVGYPHTGVNRSAGLPTFDRDIRVTLPEPLVVASNGRLADVERDGNRATHTPLRASRIPPV